MGSADAPEAESQDAVPDADSASSGGPFGFLSRRRFLSLTLGTGVVLGTGGGLWVRGPVPPTPGLKVLSGSGYRTFQDICRATLGSEAFDASELDLAATFDAYLENEPGENVRQLRMALQIVELSPLALGPRRTTFARLSESEREELWASFPLSDHLLLRKISLGFRKFINLVFYDQPAAWALIGYPGPSLQNSGRREAADSP